MSQFQPDCPPPARSQPRLLMLTHRLPYPPDRGDRIRSYHLLRELAPYFRITLASITDETPSPEARSALEALAETLIVQRLSPGHIKRRCAAAMLTGRPATPNAFYHRPLAKRLAEIHREQPFDAVLTFCTGMIRYARHVIAARPDVLPHHVLDLVDVDSLKWAAYAKHSAIPRRWVYAAEARRLRRVEADPVAPVDAVTVISEAEAKAYRQHITDHPGLEVIPNGVDTDHFKPLADPENHTLVFTAVLNYRPNVDAILWFNRHVLPAVRQDLPETRLLVVGRDPVDAIRRLDGRNGVEVIGPVPDVRPYIAQASVVVAPLQLARGVQNKVLEAMACQRAVVCSPAAAQGINARAGLHLAVAANAKRFVHIVERLLSHPRGRQRMAQLARQQVCLAYDWSSVLAPMRPLLSPPTTAPIPASAPTAVSAPATIAAPTAAAKLLVGSAA